MKIVFSALLISFGISIAFAQESFRLEWKNDETIRVTNGIIDAQGNTLVIGAFFKNYDMHSRDGFIFRMAPNGSYTSFRFIAAVDSSAAYYEIIQLDDGNYMVFGSYGFYDGTSSEYTNSTIIVHIFDQELNLISKKQYDIPSEYYGASVSHALREDSGHILCTGSAKRINGQPINNIDLALFRFTQEGDTIQTSFQHYDRNVAVYDFEKIPGSENYLLLEFITQLYGNFEWFILKPDLTKDTSNYFYSDEFLIGYPNSDYWYPNKDIMLAADMHYWDASNDYFDLGVFRADTLANISNWLCLSKPESNVAQAWEQTMAFADEQSIYITGYTTDFDCQTPDSIILYAVDTALNQVAYKALGGKLAYDIKGVLTAADGGAILYGIVWHPKEDGCHANLVIYYVSRDELGLPPVKVFEINNREEQGLAYPNPACDYVNIQLPETARTGTARIRLFNSNGKKVYDYRLPSGGNTAYLQISNLSSGVYIYHIVDNETVLTQGKFVKQ